MFPPDSKAPQPISIRALGDLSIRANGLPLVTALGDSLMVGTGGADPPPPDQTMERCVGLDGFCRLPHEGVTDYVHGHGKLTCAQWERPPSRPHFCLLTTPKRTI
jgi:hypothetical protein